LTKLRVTLHKEHLLLCSVRAYPPAYFPKERHELFPVTGQLRTLTDNYGVIPAHLLAFEFAFEFAVMLAEATFYYQNSLVDSAPYVFAIFAFEFAFEIAFRFA